MANKKIKLKLKTPSILNKLGYKDEALELIIDIEENKDIYKLLSTDEEVIDWDFIEDDESDKEIITEPNKTESCDSTQTCPNLPEITGYNELATFIEACWRICKKSPGIIFGTNLFTKTLNVEYDKVGSEAVSINHAMLKMILEAYYNMINIDDAIRDTIEKLKNNWKAISNLNTLVEVSNQLYRIK